MENSVGFFISAVRAMTILRKDIIEEIIAGTWQQDIGFLGNISIHGGYENCKHMDSDNLDMFKVEPIGPIVEALRNVVTSVLRARLYCVCWIWAV